MGLEIVLKEIEDSTNKKVDIINSEALRESEEIIENARKQVREILGSKIAEAEEKIEKRRRQVLSSANLEVKRLQLNKKKELLESVYLNAIQKIKSMTPEKDEELLTKLIKKYEMNDAYISSNSKSESIVRKLSKLKYKSQIDCIGGIVIENENGSIKEDFTYDSILKNVYERNLKSISDILNG